PERRRAARQQVAPPAGQRGLGVDSAGTTHGRGCEAIYRTQTSASRLPVSGSCAAERPAVDNRRWCVSQTSQLLLSQTHVVARLPGELSGTVSPQTLKTSTVKKERPVKRSGSFPLGNGQV